MGIFDDLLKEESFSSATATATVAPPKSSDASEVRILGEIPATPARSTKRASTSSEDEDIASLLLVPTATAKPEEKAETKTETKTDTKTETKTDTKTDTLVSAPTEPKTPEALTEVVQTTGEPTTEKQEEIAETPKTEKSEDMLGAFADLFVEKKEPAPQESESPAPSVPLEAPIKAHTASRSRGTVAVRDTESSTLSNIWDEEETPAPAPSLALSIPSSPTPVSESEDPADIMRDAVSRLRDMLSRRQASREEVMQEVVDINEQIGRLKSEAKALAQKAREIATQEEQIQKTVTLLESQIKA